MDPGTQPTHNTTCDYPIPHLHGACAKVARLSTRPGGAGRRPVAVRNRPRSRGAYRSAFRRESYNGAVGMVITISPTLRGSW